VLEADAEGSLSVLTAPPVNGVVLNWGDSGAIGEGEVIGDPMADGGAGVVVVCGAIGAVSFGGAGVDFD